ncbi:MAG: hypothetical protein FI687_04440 [SAR202 cluster bacterium]|nr:hypothetical protein [SAR202 cluster bacterium]|tara:strand:- start:20009 stop:20290 length:282 start_codon:yes stop_codon:yes gene_type:complete
MMFPVLQFLNICKSKFYSIKHVFASQIFLSGIFIPISEMPQVLQLISEILLLKHAIFSLSQIMLHDKSLNNILPQLFAFLGFAVVSLAAGTAL